MPRPMKEPLVPKAMACHNRIPLVFPDLPCISALPNRLQEKEGTFDEHKTSRQTEQHLKGLIGSTPFRAFFAGLHTSGS
jgi:hypothetical protein